MTNESSIVTRRCFSFAAMYLLVTLAANLTGGAETVRWDFESASDIAGMEGVELATPGHNSPSCAKVSVEQRSGASIGLRTHWTIPEEGGALRFDYRQEVSAGELIGMRLNLHTQNGKYMYAGINPSFEWTSHSWDLLALGPVSTHRDKGSLAPGDVITRITLYGRAADASASHTLYLDNVILAPPPPPPPPLAFGTYYVSPSGDDADAGTREAPFATLARVSVVSEPGTTIVLLPGRHEGQLRPASSGTAAQPIVVRSEPRLAARLIGSGDGRHAVVLDGVSHLRLEGLHIAPDPPRGAWIRMRHCTHITVDDCRMENSRGGMPMHFEDSEDLRLQHCVIQRHRGGNMFRMSSCSRVVMEGSTINRTGHSPFQMWPDHSNRALVIRGNVFNAAWGRAFEHFGTQDVLFEHNIVTHSFNSGRSASANAKFATTRGIFRFNRVFRNPHGPIHLYPFRDVWLDRIHVYNNVFDDNGHYGIAVSSSRDQVRDVIFTNNIFSRSNPHGGERQFQARGGTADQLRMLYNVFSGTRRGLPLVYDYGEAFTLETLQSDAFQAEHGARYRGNRDVDPGYLNPDIYNHALRDDSPLRNAGTPLTHATGSGQSDLLTVEDATPFYDGYGIEGEMGDWIAVGAGSRRARVVETDPENKVLRLDRDLRWQEGDPVSLAWSGEAPDIGVYEHGNDGRASVQVVAEPFTVAPGEAVMLRAVLHGEAQAVQARWWLGDGQIAEGMEIVHTYQEASDYPVRVRVIDAQGRAHYGPGYVWVEKPKDPAAPLVHSTWNRDDDTAWWLWKSYRPMPARYRDIVDPETGEGYRRVHAEEDNVRLPAQIHPVGWVLDTYPSVRIRYRVGPGTPIAIRLRTFTPTMAVVAATPAAEVDRDDRVADHVLHDDGDWHELTFDARLIRGREPGAQVMEGMHVIDWPRSAVRKGHFFELDEVVIAPALD